VYANGLTPRIVPGSCFALDIDTPSDLETLLEQQPRCQTAIYLNRSGIGSRLISQQSLPGDQA
jgi:2-phospho-L-lactate guanylyltransferase (CobY/MobA/RfbA family)